MSTIAFNIQYLLLNKAFISSFFCFALHIHCSKPSVSHFLSLPSSQTLSQTLSDPCLPPSVIHAKSHSLQLLWSYVTLLLFLSASDNSPVQFSCSLYTSIFSSSFQLPLSSPADSTPFFDSETCLSTFPRPFR